MNKFLPHVYVLPEDDRNRQIASGFGDYHRVDQRRIQVMPVAGGWTHVLATFQDEYIRVLQNYVQGHVVMLIDFDGQVETRRAEFEQAIPDDLKTRVFVLGSKDEPETLKRLLNTSFEKIGESLAAECDAGTSTHWDHEQLRHNDAERRRLLQSVKPFLF